MSRRPPLRVQALRAPLARGVLAALALVAVSACGFSGEPEAPADLCVAGRACSTAGIGACAEGLTRCPEGPEGAIECAPVTTGSPELCDAIDNDCDGRTDEDLPDEVIGSDVGVCQPQIRSCRMGSYELVQSAIGPQAEVCGDGIDQDCNGADCNGPPRVQLLSPAPGSDLVEGARIEIRVEASDDQEVERVVLLVDGAFAASDSSDPYRFTVTVPLGAGELTLEAVAEDSSGLEASTGVLRYPVIPDPGTRVTGTVVDERGFPVALATARVADLPGEASDVTGTDGRFEIPDVPTVRGDIVVEVRLPEGDGVAGRSDPTTPIPGGATEVGKIAVRTLFFEEDIGQNLRLDEDEFERIRFPEAFRFPFYGKLREELFANANGRLTFEFGDETSSESLFVFDLQPGIAPLFDGLDLDDDDRDRGVFVRQHPDRLVLTWNRVEESGRNGDSTFQVVLRSDGRIQIAYERIRIDDGLVGITPGSAARATEADFSRDTPFTGERGQLIYERFFRMGGDRFDLEGHFLLFTPIEAGDAYRVDLVAFPD